MKAAEVSHYFFIATISVGESEKVHTKKKTKENNVIKQQTRTSSSRAVNDP
jgi:hypothetical protein